MVRLATAIEQQNEIQDGGKPDASDDPKPIDPPPAVARVFVGCALKIRKDGTHKTLNWLGRIAWRLMPQPPVSILFEQYLRERRMRVMQLFAESTFDVDNALES
jgi:hypothetical protein